MNLFEQFSIGEVANVTLYSIDLDKNDDEIYIPVLYLDTLKVSNVEETVAQVAIEGGIGESKLICWDAKKDITIELQDALFTPALNSLCWGGTLGLKSLKLKVQHFYDKETDYGSPTGISRTGTLYVNKLSDFFIIRDKWNYLQGIDGEYRCEKQSYVGDTSIFCWLVSGVLISDDETKKVKVNDLILFYRQTNHSWYFFNGYGIEADSEEMAKLYSKYYINDTLTNKDNIQANFQQSKEAFDWIRNNIANLDVEPDSSNLDSNSPLLLPKFLTQNLYIDGFKKNVGQQTTKYTDNYNGDGIPNWSSSERKKSNYGDTPFRYFVNIGVPTNSDIALPQEAMFQIDTIEKKTTLIERMDKVTADRDFCIDTDINLLHGEYRYINKYHNYPLTVYLNPNTLKPYLPNETSYITQSGDTITGNLRVIRQGETFLIWKREVAQGRDALGKQLIIDTEHFPGFYRLVGETIKKDRLGKEHRYQFEIPLCKLHSDNKISLSANSSPQVFSMKLTVLRRDDKIMMKLTEYDINKEEGNGNDTIVPIVGKWNEFITRDLDKNSIHNAFEGLEEYTMSRGVKPKK